MPVLIFVFSLSKQLQSKQLKQSPPNQMSMDSQIEQIVSDRLSNKKAQLRDFIQSDHGLSGR